MGAQKNGSGSEIEERNLSFSVSDNGLDVVSASLFLSLNTFWKFSPLPRISVCLGSRSVDFSLLLIHAVTFFEFYCLIGSSSRGKHFSFTSKVSLLQNICKLWQKGLYAFDFAQICKGQGRARWSGGGEFGGVKENGTWPRQHKGSETLLVWHCHCGKCALELLLVSAGLLELCCKDHLFRTWNWSFARRSHFFTWLWF